LLMLKEELVFVDACGAEVGTSLQMLKEEQARVCCRTNRFVDAEVGTASLLGRVGTAVFCLLFADSQKYRKFSLLLLGLGLILFPLSSFQDLESVCCLQKWETY
jgi:hypothetical protein